MINWTSITTFQGYLATANTSSGGYFWLGMLFMVVVILIIIQLNAGIEATILSGAFAGLIGGIFLVYMDLIAWQWVLVFIGLILFIFFYIGYKNNG